MKVAIIGANGFLGKHFYKFLSEQPKVEIDIFTRLFAGDITRFYADDKPILPVKGLWANKYDVIIHCAYTKDKEKQKIIDEVIVLWWKFQKISTTLITFGSDICYAENEANRTERNYLKGYYEEWKDLAETKRRLITEIGFVNKPSIHFILTSLFGPDFDLMDFHLVHDLIKKAYKRETLEVTSGSAIRECVYAPDAVENVWNILQGFNTGPHLIYNLGSPKKRSTVLEIAENICLVLNQAPKIVDFNMQDRHPLKWLDSSKAIALLGDKWCDTPWLEALSKTVKPILDNHGQIELEFK